MSLKYLLKWQFTYCIVGILFNVISQVMINNGHQALTPTVPVKGIFAMSIYGIFLLAGYFLKIRWYRFLMLISIIIFGYGGVLKHFFTYQESPELYHSLLIAMIGITINIFGLIVNLLAAFGKFENYCHQYNHLLSSCHRRREI